MSDEPDEQTAIVDIAGLDHIRRNPRSAKGASGSIYELLKIRGYKSFPQDVNRGMISELIAKIHRYGRQECTHSVGPDFRQRPEWARNDAMQEFRQAYHAVFMEAL